MIKVSARCINVKIIALCDENTEMLFTENILLNYFATWFIQQVTTVDSTTEQNTKSMDEFSLFWVSSFVSKVSLCFSFRSLEERAALCLSAGSSSTFTQKKGILLTPNQRAWLNFSDYAHWSILWKLFLLKQFWTFYLTAYSKICSCRRNRSKYKLLFTDIMSVYYWSWP